jgi:hypothetical protein
MDTSTVSESKDGRGAGDHDSAFAWGAPASYITLRAQARLLVMRGFVRDYRHGERGGAADGDLSYTEQTDSGLYLPTTEPVPMPT